METMKQFRTASQTDTQMREGGLVKISLYLSRRQIRGLKELNGVTGASKSFIIRKAVESLLVEQLGQDYV